MHYHTSLAPEGLTATETQVGGMDSSNGGDDTNVEEMDVIMSPNDKAPFSKAEALKGGFNGLSTGDLEFIAHIPLFDTN
jgi:hypothetical protein